MNIPEKYEHANQIFLNSLAQGASQAEADEEFLAAVKVALQPQERQVAGDIMERMPPEWVPEREFEAGGLYGPEDPFGDFPDV